MGRPELYCSKADMGTRARPTWSLIPSSYLYLQETTTNSSTFGRPACTTQSTSTSGVMRMGTSSDAGTIPSKRKRLGEQSNEEAIGRQRQVVLSSVPSVYVEHLTVVYVVGWGNTRSSCRSYRPLDGGHIGGWGSLPIKTWGQKNIASEQ